MSITDTSTQLLWEAGGGEGWPFLISAVEFLSLLSQILQDCKSGAWRTRTFVGPPGRGGNSSGRPCKVLGAGPSGPGPSSMESTDKPSPLIPVKTGLRKAHPDLSVCSEALHFTASPQEAGGARQQDTSSLRAFSEASSQKRCLEKAALPEFCVLPSARMLNPSP